MTIPIDDNKLEWVKALPKKPAYVANMIARIEADAVRYASLEQSFADIAQRLANARIAALHEAANIADGIALGGNVAEAIRFRISARLDQGDGSRIDPFIIDSQA
jgi:hypothetical protein